MSQRTNPSPGSLVVLPAYFYLDLDNSKPFRMVVVGRLTEFVYMWYHSSDPILVYQIKEHLIKIKKSENRNLAYLN